MRKLLSFFICTIFAAPYLASAQANQPLSGEDATEASRICIYESWGSRTIEEMRACYTRCYEANANSLAGRETCLLHGTKAETDEVNRLYTRATEALTQGIAQNPDQSSYYSDALQRLIRSQTTWDSYMPAACAFEGIASIGGSEQNSEVARCTINMAKARQERIRALTSAN